MQYVVIRRPTRQVELFGTEDEDFSQEKTFIHQQYNEIIAYLTKKKSASLLAVRIAYYAGLRIGEVIGLSWDDINLEEQYLTACRNLSRNDALYFMVVSRCEKCYNHKEKHAEKMKQPGENVFMNSFIYALEQRNLEELRKYPKADLHNHFVLGGNRMFIYQETHKKIEPLVNPLSSMDEMNQWSQKYIGQDFNSTAMRKFLIRATFQQAREDGVTVLEIGEDVWGLNEFFNNDIDELVNAFTSTQKEIAPDIELRLQIGLSRHCPISYLEECLSHFWGNKNFYSIDLYGDELAQPIENFKGIYRRAKKEGLRLKAHVGEWGTAKDVRTAVEELELDEVQHGIAAVSDESVIRFLADNKIRLNITPTSNILLGRAADMSVHPIGKLYRSGVDVTINSDDILIFDSDVSKEYLRLYESQCLTAEELETIRKNGLKPINIDKNR